MPFGSFHPQRHRHSRGQTVCRRSGEPSVSRNPFLHFRFKGGRPGERVAITWLDNKARENDEAVIAGG